MDKPNPYAELSAAMQKLEAQGVPEADVIDAAFRLAVTAAARLYGPEAVSHLAGHGRRSRGRDGTARALRPMELFLRRRRKYRQSRRLAETIQQLG